ncbi:MAG: hypothetical protein J6U54_11425 [Clostridiales bacterium]|nr:hypothetical protein [Clostridiales bacterium]
MNERWLAHHGVKGQKWGVRNGPPYPIEDKILKKGTRLDHVSSHNSRLNSKLLLKWYNKNGRALYTYRPEEEHDAKIYQGPFAKFLIEYRGAPRLEKHSFEVKEDMLMPTKKERVDAFKEIISKANAKDINELRYVQQRLAYYDIGSKEAHNVNLYDLKTEADIKAAYEVFNHAMESVHKYKIAKAYVDYMAKRYDAMVDDNNQGLYNDAHDPIIILKTQKLMNSPEAARYLSAAEIAKNCVSIDSYMKEKYGTGMML